MPFGADTATSQLIVALISVAGGGTIVPVLYRIYLRRSTRTVDDTKAKAQIQEIAVSASHEAVEAVSGALLVVRAQLAEREKALQDLRDDRADDRAEIARLRSLLRENRIPF